MRGKRAALGKHYPLVIDGKQDRNGEEDPVAQPGRSDRGRRAHERRLEGASRRGDRGGGPRLRVLAKRTPPRSAPPTFLRRRRCCANGASSTTRCLVYEVGKSWPEADGDIAEAIDFLEFYAREALRYARPQPVVPLEGERNEMIYIPLGVGAVIPPWNFAGAIMAGMTAAAIVYRQHRRAQAVERCGDHCGVVRRFARRGRRSAGRRELHSRDRAARSAI